MIEFILIDNKKKISVNSKHILLVRPARPDVFCDTSVITLVNGIFFEVACSYDKVLRMIENNKI